MSVPPYRNNGPSIHLHISSHYSKYILRVHLNCYYSTILYNCHLSMFILRFHVFCHFQIIHHTYNTTTSILLCRASNHLAINLHIMTHNLDHYLNKFRTLTFYHCSTSHRKHFCFRNEVFLVRALSHCLTNHYIYLHYHISFVQPSYLDCLFMIRNFQHKLLQQ